MSIQSKILQSSVELETWLASAARPLVFTNGCFDILHRGHISYLEDASALGKALIVAVNSDESVRALNKGSDRPLNSLDDRMAVIAALESVAAVIAFSEDTPLELVKKCQPDHLVKGGDWPVESIVGYQQIKDSGGEVHSLAFQFNRSTTQLVEKIRQPN